MWGSRLFPWIRATNSRPSSMMVRSALNSVEKTRSKPSSRRAVTSWPVTTVPGSRPNSSPMVAWMEGAVCTTTNLSSSSRACHTASISLTSVMAPTGHTAAHWPQLAQLISAMGRSKAVVTVAEKPRPAKARADTPCTSSHTRTQRPQRMHLLGSLLKAGPSSSRGRLRFSPRILATSSLFTPSL